MLFEYTSPAVSCFLLAILFERCGKRKLRLVNYQYGETKYDASCDYRWWRISRIASLQCIDSTWNIDWPQRIA